MGEIEEQYMKSVQTQYSDAFTESLSVIIERMSDAGAVERFLNKAYSKGIVSLALKDEVISTSGVSEYYKASRLMHKIDSDLQACKTTTDYGRVQSSVLIICKILLNLDYPILKQTAKEFMTNIKEVPEVIAVSICKVKLEAFIRTIVSAPFELFHAEGIIPIDGAAATTIATTIQISNVSLLYNLIVKAIAEDSRKFEQLSAILKAHGLPGSLLAKKLTNELNEHNAMFCDNPVFNEGSAVGSYHRLSNTAVVPIRARIPSDVEKNVNEMFAKYDDLIYDIANLITNAIEQNPQGQIHSLHEIKDYLKSLRHHLSRTGEIESLTSVQEAVYFAAKHRTSVLDVKFLERFLKRFDIPKGQEKIDDYNSSLEKFKKKAKADLLNNRCISKAISTKSETIEFTIRKNLEEVLMDEIKEIICEIFEEELSSYVTVKVVSRTHSTTFTCYAPESMIQLLILKAQNNLQALIQDIGLMYLKIGYCTLLDYEPDPTCFNAAIEQVQVEESHKDEEEKPEEEYLKTIEELKQENEFALEDLRNEIKKLTTQNKNLQNEVKQLRMILEDNGIDLETFVKTDTVTDQSPDDKVKQKLQEIEFFDTGGIQSKQIELTEMAEHADTMTQLVPSKTLDSDDDSLLPEDPVKMKPLEVDKSQETVIIDEAIEQLGAETEDQDENRNLLSAGNSDMKETIMKGILRENEQLKNDEKMMSEKYLKLKDEFEKHEQDSDQKVQDIQKALDEKEKELMEQKRNTATLKDQHTILQDEFSEKEKELTEQKRNTATLQDQHTILQDEFNKRVPILSFYHQSDGATANYPPVAMVMTNFNEHKKKNIQWFSPAFYSHRGGYKLCLKMDAQGRKGGQGTHLSASVHVMKGEYDDQLEWPLTAEVQLELLNRYMDSNHRAVTLRIDESSTRESRERVLAGIITDSGICASRGISEDRFVPHTDLDTLYLKDDSICIRVNSIKINRTRPPLPLTETSRYTFNEVHEFTLSNFSKLKAKNERWKSKPFYTHENGYKFIMTVHPNGEYTYKGSQIAMFLHLMMGDYDNQLSFPFRGTLYVQLVNRMGDHSHAQFPVKFNRENDPKGKHGARVTRYSTDNMFEGFSVDGWGTASFIRHDLLPRNEYRNTEYLRNDELLFRINKIEII